MLSFSHLFKLFSPFKELFYALVTEFLQTTGSIRYRQHSVRMRFREKFVGITYQLFLKCLWGKILFRKRQVLSCNLLTRQSCARMALAHTRMLRKALLPEYLPTNKSMTDIRFFALTEDAGRMTPADADIVEHGSLFNESSVKLQFRMTLTGQDTFISHLARMFHQQRLQVVVLRIVFIDQNLIIHHINHYHDKRRHRWSPDCQ